MRGNVRIAPSILAANFACMADEIVAMERAGADAFHLDIMDGHFVPNISFGPQMVRALRNVTDKPFDAHLMIAPAEPYIKEFADAGADSITVHPESGPHLHRLIQSVKALGKLAGVALNPATPAEAVLPVLGDIDLILVMSVNPGFGGQDFIVSQLDKVRRLRQLIDGIGRPIDLQIDGGINFETAAPVIEAGVDLLVAGTASFAGGPARYGDNLRRLRGD